MASDEPLPDRCGAHVVDKLGIECRLGPESSDQSLELTDTAIGLVRLADSPTDPSHIVEVIPVYRSLRKWLWDDYVLDGLALRPEDPDPFDTEGCPKHDQLVAHDAVLSVDQHRPPSGEDLKGSATYKTKDLGQLPEDVDAGLEAESLFWIHVDGTVDHNLTNRYNELQGYCERYPETDKDRCYQHKNRLNELEGEHPNKDNTYRMTHGLYARRTSYYQAMDEADKQWIETMVDSWLEDAPFDRTHAAKVNELYRTAIDQHRAMRAVDEFVEDGQFQGMTTEQTIAYDEQEGEITAIDEHPANLPYSRLDRDIVKKLKEMEIYGDGGNEDDSSESIAKLLSGIAGAE